MKNKIKEIKRTIAFFENEKFEFAKSKKDDERALSGAKAGSEEYIELTESIQFFQEFIDDAEESLKSYKKRLKELL